MFGDLPLSSGAITDRPWGAVMRAPGVEADLPGALDVLTSLVGAGPALAVVYGGTPVNRALLCEHARMSLGVPALLVDSSPDLDRAVTAVLSGRADLVGVPAVPGNGASG